MLAHFPAHAQVAPEVSPIRQAAIEKLQEKLGTMRGSIKPKERNIFLTPKMVNRFKPIEPVETADPVLDEAASTPSIDSESVSRKALENRELTAEIMRQAEDSASKSAVSAPAETRQIGEQATDSDDFKEQNLPISLQIPAKDSRPETLDKAQVTTAASRPESAPPVERERSMPVAHEITDSERSELLRQQIFDAIRLNQSRSGIDATLITNSTGSGTLPNTSDMNVLRKAVDKMVAGQD